MKKLLISLASAGAVAALAFGATTAFFSDSETSIDNKFQTGNIDLKIASTATYNGAPVTEATWDYRNLSTVDKFFNFTDLKPGDQGENTISYEITTNDAWMCANLDVKTNSDLGKYLNIVWWVDDGDNKLGSNEKVLFGGPRTVDGWLTIVGKTAGQTGVLPLTLADSYLNHTVWPEVSPSPNTLPILANQPHYIGVGWCFGAMTLTPDSNPGFTCDGSGSNNDAQGDQIIADLSFYVEQHRNNPDFLCTEHLPQ